MYRLVRFPEFRLSGLPFSEGLLLFIVCLTGLFLNACSQNKDAQEQEEKVPLRMMAYKYLQKNQAGEAENAFLKAIKTTPDEILNYRDLAILYLTEGKYDLAEDIAKNGLAKQSNDIDLQKIRAEIYIHKKENQRAIEQLNDILKQDPKNAFAYYTLANLQPASQKSHLLKALSLSPDNVVIRLALAELFTQNKQADSATFYCQGIKKIAPEFSPALSARYSPILQSLQRNDFTKALASIASFRDLFKLTSSYTQSLSILEGPTLSIGYADFLSSEFLNKSVGNEGIAHFKFSDATTLFSNEVGKTANASSSVVAASDYSGTGEMYLYTSSVVAGKQNSHFLISKMGGFQENQAIDDLAHTERDFDADFVDYDNDGYLDLFVATANGIRLYKNNGDGTFMFKKDNIGLGNSANTQKMLFADLDQDGDLDLYAASTNRMYFFRNNSDGTFTEQANAMGLGLVGGVTDMDFADYDLDGDLDVITASETNGVHLLLNNRHAKFTDATVLAGLADPAFKGKAVAFADYNNDGMPDLFIAGSSGKNSVLKNTDGKRFTSDPSSKIITDALQQTSVQDAVFLDFDNDGYMDLLVAGTPANASAKGVHLFHNEAAKKFSDVSHLLPKTIPQAYQMRIVDFNEDGDDDVFLATSEGAKLLRNDSGDSNHFMQVRLTGLSYGNTKNNRLGIGAQVELKAGDLYQSKTITRAVTNFGVGPRSKLDAVRIIWPNGTPQVIADPSEKQRTLEAELQKGSCPFLFAWNGHKYEFVKDMMWRSALGMPMAINGKDTTYAFSDPSKEYLLIPGEKLQPQGNKYTLKITEELWEAVYFDKLNLIAVDHPESVDVFVDERFTLPPFPGKKVYPIANKQFPVTVLDGNGHNALPKVKAYDFDYIASFGIGKYQGLAEDHDLVLDLGNKAISDSLYLFLRGWIFPTDASINTAMTQSKAHRSSPPSLQVINRKGEWETVIPNIGFPMGKDKMVLVNLTGKFLTPNNRKVRIRTNMQIYWDEIFFATQQAKTPVNLHDMTMTGANLAFRGYSKSYPKGGPFGPHWFDYYTTTKGQKWRDLTGYYTRYGDVMPLLGQADDEYIIANSGDEITIDFDAQKLPSLPKGWKRDFLIYSEGWVKDGDLNTALGQTVTPLPFHRMPSYPYGRGVAYPTDEKHKQYQRQYNTRLITTDRFRQALLP